VQALSLVCSGAMRESKDRTCTLLSLIWLSVDFTVAEAGRVRPVSEVFMEVAIRPETG
jgi:hypothetical protein